MARRALVACVVFAASTLLPIATATTATASFVTAAHAWSPSSHELIGRQAARLAPPDLYRQLARNRDSYLLGLRDPAQRGTPEGRYQHADGSGRLAVTVHQAVDNAVASIREHRPFNEISYRLGVVAHYLALANSPLATGSGDATEARWRGDFARYAESAAPRVRFVFYGFRPGRFDLQRLLDASFRRSRGHYPMLGREYRRIDFGSGVRGFDDRSTAYAVTSLGYSHAVSDIAETLRYIWLEAGGIDTRPSIPRRGQAIVRLSPLDATIQMGR
ncbi:MAG: hypothetical protein AAGC60_08200 [Acidobacteriota bacterium]